MIDPEFLAMRTIRWYGTMADAMGTFDPFCFSDSEKRESGHTANRSLAETRRALDAWFDRQRARGNYF